MTKTSIPVLMFAAGCAWAHISPSRLEVNLGPLPVDQYTYSNLNSSGLVSGCSASTSIRACYQSILSGYASQGGHRNPLSVRACRGRG